MRNATLAERQADAQALELQIREHPQNCVQCTASRAGRRGPACDELTRMRADLKTRRQAIRTWFDPSPDAPALF